MRYMLDTNICIYIIKKMPPAVLQRFSEHEASEFCISSVTYAEMMHGVEKSQAKERNRLALMLFMSPLTVLDFDVAAAETYGKLWADLEQRGTPIGPMDMLIAGHALSQGLTLVTNNTREFSRVSGLRLENWAE